MREGDGHTRLRVLHITARHMRVSCILPREILASFHRSRGEISICQILAQEMGNMGGMSDSFAHHLGIPATYAPTRLRVLEITARLTCASVSWKLPREHPPIMRACLDYYRARSPRF